MSMGNAMRWHGMPLLACPPLASSLKAVSIPSPSCVPGVSCLVSEFHPHSLLLLPDVPYVRALMGKHPSATGAPCGRRLPMSLAAFSSCRSIWYVSGLLFSPLALLVDLGSLPDPPHDQAHDSTTPTMYKSPLSEKLVAINSHCTKQA